MSQVRRILWVHGTVQGVGFRPFVYRQAVALGLSGLVQNHPQGVRIEIEGAEAAVAELVRSLRHEGPPLAVIGRIEEVPTELQGSTGFCIAPSDSAGPCATHLPVDTAPCAECLRELFARSGRRAGYAFINCTRCGPRLSIVRALPYDRASTTMADFALCPDCLREYHDPADRRYHAEPSACRVCGPRLIWDGPPSSQSPLLACLSALRSGQIVAIKGVGGFQLACDASDGAAVQRLRERKRRAAKPFALLAPNLDVIAAQAELSEPERASLLSPRRPIVLLRRRADSTLAPQVAPALHEVGFMLPASPLHYLLATAFGRPLVMTSGNLSEEPIARDDREARCRLQSVADAFLTHDREIAFRLDDSVVRSEGGAEHVLRRARGYAPTPIPLRAPRPLLAVGADLKNTLCLADGESAVVSPHIGDLHDPKTRAAWRETLSSLTALLGVAPTAVACDLHPDYISTRLAESLGLPLVRVQHHHAHLAACLAESGLSEPVIGVVFDGAGHGEDGASWGGEVLIADRVHARRAAHLRYVPLPGGDAAAREPWRMALAYLLDLGETSERFCLWPGRQPAVELLALAIRRGVNSPLTSSVGRLFDAVAALTGLCRMGQFEGQAAMMLEAQSTDPCAAPYAYCITGRAPAEIDLRPGLRDLLRDLAAGRPVAEVGSRFHATLAAAVAEVVGLLSREHGLRTAVLTGGCFQNALLGARCQRLLEQRGLRVLRPVSFPPGDGGISLGQIAVAAARLTE